METNPIDSFPPGILYEMLADAYSGAPELVGYYENEWRDFDGFVFGNPDLLKSHGFISTKNGEPVGFMTWDPRGLPGYVRIGHNCIIAKRQGRGLGGRQLSNGLKMIGALGPKAVRVTTGNTPFFLPARKMYESAGFARVSVLGLEDYIVPEIVEYELSLL